MSHRHHHKWEGLFQSWVGEKRILAACPQAGKGKVGLLLWEGLEEAYLLPPGPSDISVRTGTQNGGAHLGDSGPMGTNSTILLQSEVSGSEVTRSWRKPRNSPSVQSLFIHSTSNYEQPTVYQLLFLAFEI